MAPVNMRSAHFLTASGTAICASLTVMLATLARYNYKS